MEGFAQLAVARDARNGCLFGILVAIVLVGLAFVAGFWFAGHSVKVRSPIVVQEPPHD